jgi:SAM-dependent methyltransferase
MSSYKSHMPPELEWKRLCGLGMNDEELRANDQLTEYLVHNLNAKPAMPFGDEEFDGAVVTVSVQYMTKPLEIFREVRRVLKPDAPFIVTYSNRMFPTKAVRIWRALDDRERAGLIATYFKHAGGFGEVSMEDRSIDSGGQNDPLFAVWARKLGD